MVGFVRQHVAQHLDAHRPRPRPSISEKLIHAAPTIAERFRVPPAHVAVGCGSVGVAQQLLEAVGDPGAEVVYAWRSFEAYPYLSDLAGVASVRVPLRGGELALGIGLGGVDEGAGVHDHHIGLAR